MAYKGVDISSWQGNIDIKALANQLDFFIFRGYVGTSKDSKVERDVNLCIEANKPYGLYIYSYALNTDRAEVEARNLINLANSFKVKPNFLVIDMEDADGYKRKNGMPSNQTLKAICTIECEAFEKAGYYAMIYASSSWFKNQLSGLNRFDKWVAHWPTKNGKQTGNNTSPDGENANNCGIWQYTSDGYLNGYNGRLDLNYGYKDFIVKGFNVNPQPIPTPTPTTYTFRDFVTDVQKATGAKVDGIPGANTLAHTITVSQKINRTHKVVTPLERYLKELGYYTGEIEADKGKTPIFGNGMENAVKQFQRDKGLKIVDGIITAKANTWKKLLKLI